MCKMYKHLSKRFKKQTDKSTKAFDYIYYRSDFVKYISVKVVCRPIESVSEVFIESIRHNGYE